MDIETLRELVNVFKELGGEAKEAFIWYLIVKYVPPFVFGVAWTVIGYISITKLIGIISGIIGGHRLMLAYGLELIWNERDLSEACEALREYKKMKSQKNRN